MRSPLLFALLASLTVLATSPLSTGADEVSPTVVPLTVTQPLEPLQECLAIVAAETPAEREARVVGGMAYVRTFYPDLDEAGLRESSEDMLEGRCKLAPIELPPARKELVGDRWVVHAGEHSIQHDYWHGLATSPGAPMNIHFFGVPFYTTAGAAVDAGVAVKNAIDSSGWQVTGCGDDKMTAIYDGGHGGGTYYPYNAYDMQREENECTGSARYHIRLWPSPHGDTHPGPTYGGYVLGSVHHEDWWPDPNGPDHHPDTYDGARNTLRSNLLASGLADAYFAVDVGNGNPNVDSDPDGQVFYMHMKTPTAMRQPTPACSPQSIVRVYEDSLHGGNCKAFDLADGTFADDTFPVSGASLNDRVSSVYVAPGYTARFSEHAGHGGAQRTSRCSDPNFAATFNDIASSVKVHKSYLDFCYATFSAVRGNEWWVQATVTPKGPDTVNAVQVRINGGSWLPLTNQGWGWAASYHIPQGSVVQLRAIAGTGSGGGGADLSACYNWIPAPNTDATTQYCNFADSPFKASFVDVRGNAWWVQATVPSSDPVGGVEMRLSCNLVETAWVRLSKQGWTNGWGGSFDFAIPAGATIDFRAHPGEPNGGPPKTISELDVSRGYIWPAVTPPATAAATPTAPC